MFPVYEQKKENVHILQKTSRHAPPHLHNSVEFIYVISGSMEIGMGQELFIVAQLSRQKSKIFIMN